MIIPELQGKKVLVVEDDDVFRQSMTSYLRKKGMDVSFASNGKYAREILTHEIFDLIVSDVQMPQLNGIELLKWIKAFRPTPFILITGFTNLLETQTAFDIGADEFIAKPFRNADLIAAVVGVLVSGDNKPRAASIEEFDQIPVESIGAQIKLSTDLYLRLSHVKLVRIAAAGEELTNERLRQFRDRGLRFLYTPKAAA